MYEYISFFIFTGIKTAFTVNFPSAGLTPKTIRFTSVITSIGGHYSTSIGIFTCEYPGIYVFSLHIMKLVFSTDAYCYIRKNRSNVVGAWTDPDSASDNGWYSSSTSGVIHLVHGDQVDVGGCSNITSFYTTYYTTFSGFLPKAD